MAGLPFSAACVNCIECSAANAVQSYLPLGGTLIRSSPRQRSDRKGRRELATCSSSRPAPGTALFPRKSRARRGANAALSEDRFQSSTHSCVTGVRKLLLRGVLCAELRGQHWTVRQVREGISDELEKNEQWGTSVFSFAFCCRPASPSRGAGR